MLLFSNTISQAHALDTRTLGNIPILHEGRIKPLDTFAKVHLQQIHGANYQEENTAMDWLAEMLFDPEQALKKPLLSIPAQDIQLLLGLPKKKSPYYTYNEVTKQMGQHSELFQTIVLKDPNSYTATEQALSQLYENISSITQMAGSMSLMLPLDMELSELLRSKLKLPDNLPYTYLNLSKHNRTLQNELKSIIQKKGENLEQYTAEEKEIATLSFRLAALESTGANNHLLRLIPSSWSKTGEWFAPWALINNGQGSPETSKLIDLWSMLTLAYHSGDDNLWNQTIREIETETINLSEASPGLLSLEILFHQLDLVPKTTLLYITAFFIALIGYLWNTPHTYRIAIYGIIIAIALHTITITIRMILLERPPVSTLYESILFVSWIVACYGLWLSQKRGLKEGLLIGSFLGALLLAISGIYAARGDTMALLIAVLNTNFWLATHVVVITIGYGCALITGTLAHLALITGRKPIYQSLQRSAIIALLFTTIGTILGGIWADQSWGRFWGWDPKENGALLIVLWLVWLLHGRMTPYLNKHRFAALLAFTNVIVAISWFGVNLLNVGLHSYGFTNTAAVGFVVFCTIETILISALYARHSLKQKATT